MKVSRVVAATGIAIGLTAIAAPTALADAYIVDSDGGDVAIQDVGGLNSGTNVQAAQNDVDLEFKGIFGNSIADQVQYKIKSAQQ